MGKTRVFIVDDSIFFRKFLMDSLSAFPNIEVAGYAANALDAKQAIPHVKPDVVTLDVEMPGMSGTELLKHLMVTHPVPVVMVSAVNINVFDALSAGAVNFVKKPDVTAPGASHRFIQELADEIEIAKTARLKMPAPVPEPVIQPRFSQSAPARQGQPVRHSAPALAKPELHSVPAKPEPSAVPVRPRVPVTAVTTPSPLTGTKSVLIALGASTGGTEATLTVLKELPKNTPGIVIVQHMPPGFTKMYADRLNTICPMEVREAKDGDRVERGLVLIAPGGDMQMQVVRSGSHYAVKCYYGEKVSGHCPSVDVLFHSAAVAAGKDAVGIIMTGMGKDGAEGLLAMRQKGAYTIGQNKETCVVYGMPMVAYNIGAVAQQAACENIAATLKSYLNRL